MERKLAAIIAADLVGYSRLMEADETGTLSAVSQVIKDTIEPLISRHRGRIVKLMGDGVLAEFGSIVDAVTCAIEWQAAMNQKAERLQFRIGIHLGDIIYQDGDIFGNGVNIAARLEALADPGGICLSGAVHAEIKNRFDISFENLGLQDVKNISEPVHAFRIANLNHSDAAHLKTSTAYMLPEKPSVAVLPLTNMSGDPEQDYFSDGISEDIIIGLSRFKTLFVIARNSSFSFKGQTLDIKEIGRKLGVQYLVEGSVRRAGNRVRITVQLIEAETGNHIWAERYDRDLEDVFAVQDDVTKSIVAVLPGRVQEDVASRSSRKPTSNMKAHELMLQAKALRDRLNVEDTAKARQLLEQAIALDPGYARAHMYLADTYVVDLWLGLAVDDASAISLRLSKKGAGLDSKDVYIQDQLGFAYLCEGMWDDAEVQFEKTLSQIVNEAESMAWCGYAFMLLGRHEKASEVVAHATQLDPLHPPALDWILGQVHFFSKRYEDVIRVLMGDALLNSVAHMYLVAAYAHLGRREDARVALSTFIEVRRHEFEVRGVVVESNDIQSLAGGYRQLLRDAADWSHIADGLQKAGLPDTSQP